MKTYKMICGAKYTAPQKFETDAEAWDALIKIMQTEHRVTLCVLVDFPVKINCPDTFLPWINDPMHLSYYAIKDARVDGFMEPVWIPVAEGRGTDDWQQ